ncbi:hypothetical protein ACP87_09875 [Pseudomonas oleovorans]|nr:Arc family DNA-binding protein [Pseudomonas oleovorans]MBN7118055.1 hypothetical protein [Pseudomonas oleovorans]MBN7131972.1 hypothetical protein [Pseudomonas oleovorans]MBN7141866.1 hypothetical protein [Pseudomonas oleovorans]
MRHRQVAPSRTADKFVVRLPADMRGRVDEAAGQQYTSMNTFIVQAIAEKLDRDRKQQLLLEALAAKVLSTTAA